jgi:hypothetical protein
MNIIKEMLFRSKSKSIQLHSNFYSPEWNFAGDEKLFRSEIEAPIFQIYLLVNILACVPFVKCRTTRTSYSPVWIRYYNLRNRERGGRKDPSGWITSLAVERERWKDRGNTPSERGENRLNFGICRSGRKYSLGVLAVRLWTASWSDP